MSTKVKYPRTKYLFYSGSIAPDGKVSKTNFIGEYVVITEKMDGENTSMSDSYFHARSLDGNSYPSRNIVKGLWGSIKHLIPSGLIITGENVYAQHTIAYDNLKSYFYMFGLWDATQCYDWQMTKFVAEELGLEMVPALYEGILTQEVIDNLIELVNTTNKEGFVIRMACGFNRDAFGDNVAKYVKPAFKQAVDNASGHWMHQQITPNKLANG